MLRVDNNAVAANSSDGHGVCVYLEYFESSEHIRILENVALECTIERAMDALRMVKKGFR